MSGGGEPSGDAFSSRTKENLQFIYSLGSNIAEGSELNFDLLSTIFPKNDFGVKLLQILISVWNYLSNNTDTSLQEKRTALVDILVAELQNVVGILNTDQDKLSEIFTEKLHTPMAIKKMFVNQIRDINPKLALEVDLLNDEGPSRIFWNLGRFKRFLVELASVDIIKGIAYADACIPSYVNQFLFWLAVILLDDDSEFCKFKDENVFISLSIYPQSQYIGVPVIDFKRLRLPFGTSDYERQNKGSVVDRESGQLFIRCKVGYIQFGSKHMIDAFYTNNYKFGSEYLPQITDWEKITLKFLFTNGFLNKSDGVAQLSKNTALRIYRDAIKDPELKAKGEAVALLQTLSSIRDMDYSGLNAEKLKKDILEGGFRFNPTAKKTRYKSKEAVVCPTEFVAGRKFGYSLRSVQKYKRKDRRTNEVYYTCMPTTVGGASILLENTMIDTTEKLIESLVLVVMELEKQAFIKKFNFSTTRKGTVVPDFARQITNKKQRRLALRMIQLRFLVFCGYQMLEKAWDLYNRLLPDFLGGTWKPGGLVPADIPESVLTDIVTTPELCPKLIAEYEKTIFNDCNRQETAAATAARESLSTVSVTAASSTATATPSRPAAAAAPSPLTSRGTTQPVQGGAAGPGPEVATASTTMAFGTLAKTPNPFKIKIGTSIVEPSRKITSTKAVPGVPEARKRAQAESAEKRTKKTQLIAIANRVVNNFLDGLLQAIKTDPSTELPTQLSEEVSSAFNFLEKAARATTETVQKKWQNIENTKTILNYIRNTGISWTKEMIDSIVAGINSKFSREEEALKDFLISELREQVLKSIAEKQETSGAASSAAVAEVPGTKTLSDIEKQLIAIANSVEEKVKRKETNFEKEVKEFQNLKELLPPELQNEWTTYLNALLTGSNPKQPVIIKPTEPALTSLPEILNAQQLLNFLVNADVEKDRDLLEDKDFQERIRKSINKLKQNKDAFEKAFQALLKGLPKRRRLKP